MDISQIVLFKYLDPKELVKLSQYLQKYLFQEVQFCSMKMTKGMRCI